MEKKKTHKKPKQWEIFMSRAKSVYYEIKWTIQNWYWRLLRALGHKDPPSYGFFLEAKFVLPFPDEDVDGLLDEYIDLVESMNLETGGGFGPNDMFITGERTSIYDRRSLVSWLIRHGASRVYASDIREESYSEPFGAIYFGWKELDEQQT